MRAIAIISLLLSFYTTQLNADLTIRYDSVSPKQQRPVHSVSIKQDLIRINRLVGDQSSVMVNLNSGDIIQLHPKNRRYFKINAQTLNQYVSLYQANKSWMQDLINQGIQQLEPQKRLQIQNMLSKLDQPTTENPIQIKNTSQTDRILGVQCRVVSILDQGMKTHDICFSDYQQLKLDSGDIQSLEKLKQLVRNLKQSSPRNQPDLLSFWLNGLEEINGIPMKVVNYYRNGDIRSILQVGTISFRDVPEQNYRIPAGYQEQLTPVL